MLNIFNEKLISAKADMLAKIKKSNIRDRKRHFPPANKEWFNSIYAYNKNTIKLLATTDKILLKFLKSYFNLYSCSLEKKINLLPLRIRFRKLSTNRILISRAELKHTSDKVIVTLYIYNRQEKYFRNNMKISNLIDLLKKKSFRYRLIKIKSKSLKLMKKVLKQKNIFLSNVSINKKFKQDPYFIAYEKKYLKDFVLKYLQKEIYCLYFNQMLFFNKLKFKHNYILPLTKLIETIYNKKVFLNLVNLKYLHLNSYILTQTVVTKLRNRSNRLIRVLKTSLLNLTLPIVNRIILYDEIHNRKKHFQSLNFNNFSLHISNTKVKGLDLLDFMLCKLYNENFFIKKLNYNNKQTTSYVTDTVLKSIKYKSVSGVRLEGAGRLTRRNIAERSIFKVRSFGNIRDMDSSFKGLSAVMFRGHAKCNLQQTKLKSKIRMGSFGIKGWVSSS